MSSLKSRTMKLKIILKSRSSFSIQIHRSKNTAVKFGFTVIKQKHGICKRKFNIEYQTEFQARVTRNCTSVEIIYDCKLRPIIKMVRCMIDYDSPRKSLYIPVIVNRKFRIDPKLNQIIS